MGFLFIQSVQFADIPVMAAYLVLISFVFVSINLIVDLLYYVVDPRLRFERGGRPLIHCERCKGSDVNPSKVADAIRGVSRRSDRNPARYSFQSRSMPTRETHGRTGRRAAQSRMASTRCIPALVAPASSASFCGNRPGKRAVGLRADMDCLAMNEETRLPYASKNQVICMPAATTAHHDYLRRAIWPKPAILPVPCIWSFSQPKKAWPAPRR